MDTKRILDFLANGTRERLFLGDSHYVNRNTIKRAGAKWHADTKQWKAVDEAGLLLLIDTGVWMPVGLSQKEALAVRSVVERRDAKEAAQVRLKQTKELRESKQVSKEVSEEKRLGNARRELQVPDDEPHELLQAAKFGVTQEMVTESAQWPSLGPRSGISDVRRLARAVRLKIVSYEDVVLGKTSTTMRGKASDSKTGERAHKGDTGVKRGGSSSTVAASHMQKCYETSVALKKPRVAVPAKKRVEYKFTVKCGDCGKEVDSREQFVECGCPYVATWSRCSLCFLPTRQGNMCEGCSEP